MSNFNITKNFKGQIAKGMHYIVPQNSKDASRVTASKVVNSQILI